MSAPHDDNERIAQTHNLARYFVETRQVGWILLLLTLVWGCYSYNAMEKRKDPLYSNLFAVAICPWPGASADKVEQLVTRKLEEKISGNMKVTEIKSTSRGDGSIVTFKLDERVTDSDNQFDDLSLRLQAIQDLPQGAGPIMFVKDFGDVTTMMLTVASPQASEIEISIRANTVKKAIEEARRRSGSASGAGRLSLIACYPQSVVSDGPRRERNLLAAYAAKKGILKNIRSIDGNGFTGVDAESSHTDAEIGAFINSFIHEHLKPSQQHPDIWQPTIVHDPEDTKRQLMAVAGDKYSYKELEEFTDLIRRSLQTLPEVAKITRHGVINQQVNLDFSQERLASYGIQPMDLRDKFAARNIVSAGGVLEVGERNLPVRPSGEFKSASDIGGMQVATADSGAPVYLRDLMEINRDYESPARFLNYMSWKDDKGQWHRTRAVTLAVFMRSEEHIDKFGDAMEGALATLRQRLPDDLIVLKTSDQPKQVEENIDLFMMSLYEAIGLVVLTALIGFWEWQSALLIALSIPATLTMTFAMMHLLGLDIQQCSVAALIISLGLLVDDPVVAGDAIKRELAAGHPRSVASWLGPTKLSRAIMFATITNIAAYLPLLMISGEIGQFIFSLPIVITCSLIASRIASMTFVPMLGYYLLRPAKKKEGDGQSPGQSRLYDAYMRGGNWILKNRLVVFGVSLVLLIGGYMAMGNIKSSFFPNDRFNVCWVDVWLPEDAPLVATNEAALHVEELVNKTALEFGREHGGAVKPEDVLVSVTTFLGGSGPRFWASIIQELDQLNYAQVIVTLKDKHMTDHFIPKLQRALSLAVPEARCDVRILEGGKPVGMPVAVRISGDDDQTLRQLADKAAAIIRSDPHTQRIRDDWGSGALAIKLNINSDKANLAGLTNMDIANSASVGLNGYRVDVLREGDKQIPIVVRLRPEEGAQVEGMSDMYVYSQASQQKIPLSEVASISYGMEPEKIRRRNQFKTITVGGFVTPGVLPSEVMERIRPQILALAKSVPPGYKLEIGGEEEEQLKSFAEMIVVMVTSIVGIFLCLVIQFKNAVKPLIVFAGIPYGMLGALVGLDVMGQPFGFPAFMGVASLAGVIVSHVIVLFDFIEESREEGAPLNVALLHASMVRLRPVLITVSATVLGFIPLAMHGGPLWEPLCYAQIGGLTFATFVTLLLVPVIYAITVLDLKAIKWAPDSPDFD